MKIEVIRHKFVDFIPDSIEEGVLYISAPYATATHRCACGCGEIVVTPIRSTHWTFIWDGETVTMRPSIGNWSLPCQSHYFIEENRIVWAGHTVGIKDRIAKTWFYRKITGWFRRI